MNESTISEDNHQKNEYLPYNIQSYEDSLAYTKKLILIAISTISYLRSILPEEVFSTKEVEKMKFKIVRSKNSDSHTLINWIKGAFDAIEKKYLSTLSLAIYADPKNPQLVLETYDFHLSYGENVNLQISKNFSQKIKLTSLRVLRTIIATISSLEELPLKLSMNMRLIYNENVPDEYEPPGFKACNFEKYRYDQGKCRIRIGDVNCLWHQVNIEINCSNKMLKRDEFNENMDASEVSKKDLNETVELVPINISTEIKPENKLNEVENHEDTITSKIGELQVNSSNGPSPPEIRSIEKIECICNSEQQDKMKLIRCSNCRTFQHAVCYNVFCSEKENGTLWEKEFVHCCINCYHKDPELKTTDKSL
ncbi:HORMA domain-containing 1-like, partial [Brachionus plicatilis]